MVEIIVSYGTLPIPKIRCQSRFICLPRSLSSSIVLLGGSPISWKTKKHDMVLHSSVEAEYQAMTAALLENFVLISGINKLSLIIKTKDVRLKKIV